MKLEKKNMFILFFLLVGGGIFGTINLSANQHHLMEENPVFVLTDKDGIIKEEFGFSEAVTGSFAGLIPHTPYTVQILKEDGTEVRFANYTARENGIIPRISLTDGIDIQQDEKFTLYEGARKDATSTQYTLYCLLRKGSRIILSRPIRFVVNSENSPDLIRMSDISEKTRENEHIEVELACQAPPYDPSTGTIIGTPIPVFKNCFSENEDVWVAINPIIERQNYANKEARIYVVNHKNKRRWIDGTLLNDVSGQYEIVTIKPGSEIFNYHRVWSNPVAREEGYDIVVDFAPFGVYDESQDILDRLNKKGFIVPSSWICLESVAFNHDPVNDSNDAMNIRINHTEDVRVPEWKKNKKAYPAAYIRNRDFFIEAVFTAAPGVESASIGAVDLTGNFKRLIKKKVLFENGSSGPVFFRAAVSTPGEIKSFLQVWQWYFEDVNGTGSEDMHFADSSNRIYVVLQQPQSPWTTGGQTEPWAELLNICCWWARGKTTIESAAERITKHLFRDVGGLYDIEWGAPFYTEIEGISPYNLTDFIGNIPSVGLVNCYDMGKSLTTFANVLGCGLIYRYSNPFGYLNCIYAIGRDWTNNPFYTNTDPKYHFIHIPLVPGDWGWPQGRSWFGNHAFAGKGDNIFDACLTVNRAVPPDFGPPFVSTWMVDVPWKTYRRMVIDDFPPPNEGYTAYPDKIVFSIY